MSSTGGVGTPKPASPIRTATEWPETSPVRGPRLNGFMSIIRANQDVIGTLVFSGVFERHPELRVVCVEADAGWVPHWMYRADHAYKRHRHWLPAGALSRLPSDYF